MTILPVSMIFISLCALAVFFMTAWIGLLRGSINVLRGHGENEKLEKRIRIHGNFIENAPITALAMASAEALGLAGSWLWLAVASFVAGRVLHYLLYDKKVRGIAMTLTQGPAAAMAIWILLQLL